MGVPMVMAIWAYITRKSNRLVFWAMPNSPKNLKSWELLTVMVFRSAARKSWKFQELLIKLPDPLFFAFGSTVSWWCGASVSLPVSGSRQSVQKRRPQVQLEVTGFTPWFLLFPAKHWKLCDMLKQANRPMLGYPRLPYTWRVKVTVSFNLFTTSS